MPTPPHDIQHVLLQLDRIHCYDEGDGWGSAEPYLWTVFFKIDGDTVVLTDDLKLSGTATIIGTPGSHGNLGQTDVNAGQEVPIPEAIGAWQTILKPIPVPASVTNFVADIAGVIGVVCVLMEEDNVTDDGAEAGHQALNTAVENAINQIITTLSYSHPDITDDDINQYMGTVQSAVTSAVKNQQNILEKIWSWLNEDDTIGSKSFYFTQNQLASGDVVSFSERWKSYGDWEIFGHVNATVLCPAQAAAAGSRDPGSLNSTTASPVSPSDVGLSVPSLDKTDLLSQQLAAMREFRDNEFLRWPGLQRWWALAKRHIPQLTYALSGNAELRGSVRAVLAGITIALKQKENPLSDELLDHAQRILTHMQKNGLRQGRLDASRALELLPQLREKTANQAIELLSTIAPARHPRAGGGPRIHSQVRTARQ